MDGVGGGFSLAVAFVEVLGFEDGHACMGRCGVSIVAVMVMLENWKNLVAQTLAIPIQTF